MSYTLKDRVLESSVSTGTGDFVLDGAQTGYQGFVNVGDGASIPYTIQGKNTDGSLNGEWEVGIGTYHLSGNYISRDTVLESSNLNSKVAFSSGSKDVFLDLPGELVVQGPSSATNSDFVAFDGTSGKIIKDSGYNSASFATAAQGALADTAVQPGDLGTAAYLDAGQPNGVATLDSGGKVPTSQIPQMGDLNYQGTWDASTNTPTLTSSSGTKGYYYVVNVAGTTNLNGITDWQVGDWAVFNGSVWQKIDNTDAVTSVNGYTGTVVLNYTDVGAQPAGTYVTSVSGTAPVVSSGGTTPAISMHVADSTHDGYLSSTDWNTFNSKGAGNVVGPASATDNAVARFDTTTGKLIQNSVVTIDDTGNAAGLATITDINYVDFNTSYSTTLGAGQLGWDGYNTLGLGMYGGNVIQHIGEDTFFYVKASSAITKGQLCMFTGAVGSSGVLTAAPSNTIPFAEAIMGIAAEDIPLNNFGLIQITGTLKGVDTSAFLDGDVLYYDSAVTGGLTKTYPSSGPIVICAAVAKSGSGGSGVLTVRISFQTRVSASTGISVTQTASGATVTNTAPDQTVSITGAGTTTVTGTYPNFTITSNDQYVGTVTSVSGTGTVNGITLTGTVTSSGNLTLGGTLSNVSLTTQVTGTLPIANGGTNATSAGAAVANLFGFTSTATAGGSTTLTNTSTVFQLFTGTANQTIVLPVVSTLAQGWTFTLTNTSTGTLTLNSSGGNLVASIVPNSSVSVVCISTSGTSAASWVISSSTTAVWST